MKYLFSEKILNYDGTQLRSLYNYLKFDLLGNSILAFEGACAVSLDHMVDGEDQKANAKIEGHHMLHFLIEIFDRDLFSAVSLQRLMASLVIDGLREISPAKDQTQKLIRKGDDIYLDGRKLSISIATSSPVSQLIHFAVNVDNQGTPVPTLALQDLSAKPRDLADLIGKRFSLEYEDIHQATQKVHWVK